MGHIRLGRLPKTYKWREVFNALENENISPEMLARAISNSAQNEFDSLKGDKSLTFCFWFLSYIVSSSKSDSFESRLSQLGISTEGLNSGLSFAKKVSEYVSKTLNEIGRPNAFSNIAEISLNETITKLIANHSNTLFGLSLNEIQAACKKTATKKRFGSLSRQFFAAFLSRSLQYVADKEISNYVGSSKTFNNPTDLITFKNALSTYCYQSSRIVEEYSGGWFSKQSWQTKNSISFESARGFMAYAMDKVNMDLRGEAA